MEVAFFIITEKVLHQMKVQSTIMFSHETKCYNSIGKFGKRQKNRRAHRHNAGEEQERIQAHPTTRSKTLDSFI
jgi:hypothetical protein